MYIVAVGWIYVVLMMAITEHSVVGGILTFVLYGLLPIGVILYLMDAPRRRRNASAAQKMLHANKDNLIVLPSEDTAVSGRQEKDGNQT
jgi:predicted membrane channel-forming protein YqfA (hemolysin III family)